MQHRTLLLIILFLGSFHGAAAALKRKHDENIANGQQGQGQLGQGGLGQAGPVIGGDDQPKPPRVPRKHCYGASKVVATGRADWAAPVEVFISNTSPDITEQDIKEILKLCAEDAKERENNEGLGDFIVKDVKCLTKPEFENPRTNCWRVSVPFKFKEYIMTDLAYPLGWSHRPFYPPRQKREGTEVGHLAKRNRINAM